MSFKDDQVEMDSLVGEIVESVEVVGSCSDDFTSVIVIRFSNGKTLNLSSQGFNDCSSCLNVSVEL